MTTAQVVDAPRPRKPLRLWPGVLIVVLQLLVRFVLPLVAPDLMQVAALGTLGGAVLIILSVRRHPDA